MRKIDPFDGDVFGDGVINKFEIRIPNSNGIAMGKSRYVHFGAIDQGPVSGACVAKMPMRFFKNDLGMHTG
jgi:hypothetical protein